MPKTSGSPFDLLIFDCDGVLIDSETIVCRVEVQALAEIGYDLELERFMERFVGKAARDGRALIEAEMGRKLPAGFEAETARRVAEAFARELKAVAGVDGALAAIPGRRCVASSSLPERLAYTLGLTGLPSGSATPCSASRWSRAASPHPISSSMRPGRWRPIPRAASSSRTAHPASPQRKRPA